MRIENMEVILKIPFSDRPDRNGNIYPKEVVQKAFEEWDCQARPLLCSDDKTIEGSPIGVIKSAIIKDAYIQLEAVLYTGGTYENVDYNKETKTIESMKIVGFGICRD